MPKIEARNLYRIRVKKRSVATCSLDSAATARASRDLQAAGEGRGGGRRDNALDFHEMGKRRVLLRIKIQNEYKRWGTLLPPCTHTPSLLADPRPTAAPPRAPRCMFRRRVFIQSPWSSSVQHDVDEAERARCLVGQHLGDLSHHRGRLVAQPAQLGDARLRLRGRHGGEQPAYGQG